MAIPNSKQELVEAMTTTYAKLMQELACVPPALARDACVDSILPEISLGVLMQSCVPCFHVTPQRST